VKLQALLLIIKKHRISIIVVASLLLLSLGTLIVFSLTRVEGADVPTAAVEITVDGEVVATYSLFDNGTYELNGGTNVIVIEGARVYMTHSDCPDHTCENTGKVRYVGETITCLPNLLTITVRGDSDDGVDFVS
jgi:hypothetical protein